MCLNDIGCLSKIAPWANRGTWRIRPCGPTAAHATTHAARAHPRFRGDLLDKRRPGLASYQRAAGTTAAGRPVVHPAGGRAPARPGRDGAACDHQHRVSDGGARVAEGGLVRGGACRRMGEPEPLREGVTALFRLAGRSPEHVARVMRAMLGITPSEYVNRRRIAQAAFQLRMTARPVTEIAFEVGYENLSHFFHVFRRLNGTSPRSYRARLAAT